MTTRSATVGSTMIKDILSSGGKNKSEGCHSAVTECIMVWHHLGLDLFIR